MTQIRDDFRSDTVTRPSPGMRRAMADAEEASAAARKAEEEVTRAERPPGAASP